MGEKHVFKFNFHQSHTNNTKLCRHSSDTNERKKRRNNKSQRDIDYRPFFPVAKTVVNILIEALTTRAKTIVFII